MTQTIARALNMNPLAIAVTFFALPINLTTTPKIEFKRDTQRTEFVRVDHIARAHHARELLGAVIAKASNVDQDAIAVELESYIRAFTLASLPKAYKADATRVARAIVKESARHQMDPLFVMAIVTHESRFNPKVVGSAGEIGLMQVKPSTAEWISRKSKMEWKGRESLFDPETNIRVATAYLAFLRKKFHRFPAGYISAYNMGPRNVRRLMKENVIPSIYAGDVMSHYQGFYRKLDTASKSRESLAFTVSMGSAIQEIGRVSN